MTQPTREQIEAAAREYWDMFFNDPTRQETCYTGFKAGALWMQSQLQALKEQWQREAWEAAREQEMINGNDPQGQRAEMEKDYPATMRSIGFSIAWRQKYKTFEDWKANEGKN